MECLRNCTSCFVAMHVKLEAGFVQHLFVQILADDSMLLCINSKRVEDHCATKPVQMKLQIYVIASIILML